MKKNLFLVVVFLLITLLGTTAQGDKIYLDMDLKRISVNSFYRRHEFFKQNFIGQFFGE